MIDTDVDAGPSPAIALYDCCEVTWNGAPVTGNHYDVNEAGELVPVDLSAD